MWCVCVCVFLVDEEFYASAGHVMVLPCDDAEGQNVTWRREEAPPLGVDGGGVRVMDGALWFLPANSSHSGVYVCKWRYGENTHTHTLYFSHTLYISLTHFIFLSHTHTLYSLHTYTHINRHTHAQVNTS